MSQKKKTLTIYNDAVVARIHNRRITIKERKNKEGGFFIRFDFADDEANEPSVEHKCSKGKIRHSSICLTEESIEALLYSYMKFKESKKLNQQ